MLKVKVISLSYIFPVLYVLSFTKPPYQVSVYRTIGPLVCICERKVQISCTVTAQLISAFFIPPPQTVFVGGYTVFTLSVCPTIRSSDRVSVTLSFLNILKNHCWNFIKFCKHIHRYKANTSTKKLRAMGQYCWSYFPL